MLLRILATVIRLMMVLIEYPYLRRYRVKPTRDWDKHSAKLWDIANLIEPVGMVLDLPTLAASKPGLTSLARWVSCSWLRESLSDGLRFILSANTSRERSLSKLIIDSSERGFINMFVTRHMLGPYWRTLGSVYRSPIGSPWALVRFRILSRPCIVCALRKTRSQMRLVRSISITPKQRSALYRDCIDSVNAT